MALISLTSLKKPEETYQGYTYSDLKLDLAFDYTVNNQLLKNKEIKDSVNSLDYDAIKNSLLNLFTTTPGQKILNPEYGTNLMQYLFEPVSIETGNLIGTDILAAISKYEPRVNVITIKVFADQINQQYNVTLILAVPIINNTVLKLLGVLSNSGFYFNN